MKKQVISYQIRHTKLGIYQGFFKDLLYWYPKSSCPEFGILEFHGKTHAKEVADWITGALDRLGIDGDIIVEPFDRDQNIALIKLGQSIQEALRVMPPGEA